MTVVAFIDYYDPQRRQDIAGYAPDGLTVLFRHTRDGSDLDQLVRGADILVTGSTPITHAMLAGSRRLRFIQKMGVGVDRIDLRAARGLGVRVAITSGSNAVPVAELTIMLILMCLRHAPLRMRQLTGGEWLAAKEAARAEDAQLAGSVVGIVGMGAIGREVAKRVRSFEPDAILYASRNRLPEEQERLLGVTAVPLDSLLRRSGVVSLHIPLTAESRHLLSASLLNVMRPGSVLVNTSRGEVVDEEALAASLTSGWLGAAAVDVYSREPPDVDNPLMAGDIPNLIRLPHIAGVTRQTFDATVRRAFANIMAFARGEPLPDRDLVV